MERGGLKKDDSIVKKFISSQKFFCNIFAKTKDKWMKLTDRIVLYFICTQDT
jgi:hypothetical protein